MIEILRKPKEMKKMWYYAEWWTWPPNKAGQRIHNSGRIETLEATLDTVFDWMHSTESWPNDKIIIVRWETPVMEFIYDDAGWTLGNAGFGTKL